MVSGGSVVVVDAGTVDAAIVLGATVVVAAADVDADVTAAVVEVVAVVAVVAVVVAVVGEDEELELLHAASPSAATTSSADFDFIAPPQAHGPASPIRPVTLPRLVHLWRDGAHVATRRPSGHRRVSVTSSL